MLKLALATGAATLALLSSIAIGAPPKTNTFQKNSTEHMVQSLMYTPMTVDFDGLQARDAITFIKEVLDVNLIGRYADDPTGSGIDPSIPIELELEDVPALVVLEEVLSQCSLVEPCTWQVRRGYLEVGTSERLSIPGAQTRKVYPVQQLLIQPPNFDDAPEILLDRTINSYNYGSPGIGLGNIGNRPSFGSGGSGGTGGTIVTRQSQNTVTRDSAADEAANLIDLITQSIEPQAWEVNGGNQASIRYHRGTLVVRAPDFIHRQIGGYGKIPPPPTAAVVTQ